MEYLLYVYWALYVLVALGALVFVLAHVVMWGAVLTLVFGGVTRYEVTRENPKKTGPNGRLGVLRSVSPFEVVVVERGGELVFPVMQATSARYTVRGLQKGAGRGIRTENEEDWDIVMVPANEVYHPLMQGSLWDPVYAFRYWANKFTNGRHVVRAYFPFFIWGWHEMFETYTHRFVRARPKGAEQRIGMEYLDRQGTGTPPENDSSVETVVDWSDHLLIRFPHRFLSETFPVGESGYSFRADITLTFAILNIARLTSYENWSTQILALVNNAVSVYFRGGTLENRYASGPGASGDELQRLVKGQLTDPSIKNLGTGYLLTLGPEGVEPRTTQGVLSVCQALGLELQDVSLNDLIPADSQTEKAVTELLSALTKGKISAEVAKQLTQKQLEAMAGATPEQLKAMAEQTAASQIAKAGNLNWTNFTGGGGGDASANTALLVQILQALKSNQGGGGNP